MRHQYIEMGADHGSVSGTRQAESFAFFARDTQSPARRAVSGQMSR
jgi:hypothetical protein